jgi:SUMO ligase MMS21 Smc5/6 complex component
MERHIATKLLAIEEVKKVLSGSKYPSKSLMEKLLIHEELLRAPDLLMNASFYKVAQSRAKASRAYTDLIEQSGEIECTMVKKREICPLTQREVVHRFEGACGHVVEYEAATIYLKAGRNELCPHAGCDKVFAEKKPSK